MRKKTTTAKSAVRAAAAEAKAVEAKAAEAAPVEEKPAEVKEEVKACKESSKTGCKEASNQSSTSKERKRRSKTGSIYPVPGTGSSCRRSDREG